jgi:hypothetical protein
MGIEKEVKMGVEKEVKKDVSNVGGSSAAEHSSNLTPPFARALLAFTAPALLACYQRDARKRSD